MPTLRERMKQEMQLVGLALTTQSIYLKAVVRLQEHYPQQALPKLSAEQIRAYLLHLKKQSFAPNTYNVQVYGLRFFYCVTLRQPLRKLDLPTTKVTYKLPSILNSDEVKQIIESTGNIKHRALLITIYGAGLRVSEAVNLRTTDIDGKRMTLHIRCGKGGKDRYVILSPVVYQTLQTYWRACRFEEIVFPRHNNLEQALSISSASQVFKRAKAQAAIKKEGGIHSLRHAFATHLLESGGDIFAIKELLGHASIHSTVRYLEFVPGRHKDLLLPIERLELR